MRTALEVCAVRLCSPVVWGEGGGLAASPELDGLIARIAKLERLVADMAERAVKPPTQTPQTRDDEDGARADSGTDGGTITPTLLSNIQSNWTPICNALSPMLRSLLLPCTIESEGGTLQIICSDESIAKILKEKNRPLAIREALAEKFSLSTPPNLAFIVRENYNKNESKPQPAPPQEQQPTPPTPPQPEQPIQLGWDDYAQGVEAEMPF